MWTTLKSSALVHALQHDGCMCVIELQLFSHRFSPGWTLTPPGTFQAPAQPGASHRVRPSQFRAPPFPSTNLRTDQVRR
jgi:hypothetical protein